MSNPFPKQMTVKQAVVSTLAFFDLFDVPLTREEISEHYFFETPDEKKIDIYLKESPQISHQDGYFALKRGPSFFDLFTVKRQRSKQYWKKVKRWQWIFQICPFVEWVGVCNSLPIRDVDSESDIDLFIVTQPGRLFTARIFVSLLTTLFGVRRHGKKIAKRFCLSFYITEDAMDFSTISLQPYDIYLAYWVKTLQPITGNYDKYIEFMDVNQTWLKPYFKHIELNKRRYRSPKEWHKRWKLCLENWLKDPEWEKRFEDWQMKRIQSKYRRLSDKSGTIIRKDMLKFHNQDRRNKFRDSWLERIEEFI